MYYSLACVLIVSIYRFLCERLGVESVLFAAKGFYVYLQLKSFYPNHPNELDNLLSFFSISNHSYKIGFGILSYYNENEFFFFITDNK